MKQLLPCLASESAGKAFPQDLCDQDECRARQEGDEFNRIFFNTDTFAAYDHYQQPGCYVSSEFMADRSDSQCDDDHTDLPPGWTSSGDEMPGAEDDAIRVAAHLSQRWEQLDGMSHHSAESWMHWQAVEVSVEEDAACESIPDSTMYAATP